MTRAWRLLGLSVLSLLSGLVVLLAAGCGGGGGGGSLGGVNLFITDDLSTGYDHIWVTVHQVELRDTNGGFHSVYSSTEGVTVDLTRLSDGAPRFLYLGNERLPAGDYNGARVTMARSLTLVATGSGTGEACTFDPALNFGTDETRATFNFGSNEALSGDDSAVLDFDLPNWTKAGSVVTPAFSLGDDSTLGDPNRHESEDYHGTVGSLTGTAPDQEFILRRAGGDIGVTTNTDTIIFNEDSAPGPHLANGQRVEVRGTFDTTSNRLIASVIKIEDNEDDDTKVEGPTSNLDTNALTVDVEVDETEGFLPPGPIVHVQFSETTRFFTKAGAPLTLNEMLDFLATGIAVEAEGTYNSGSNTLTAAKIKLHPEDGDEHEAEAKGAVSNINAVGGTFDMTLGNWFGFSGSVGQVVHVTTDGSTVFKNDAGDTITAGEFFAALTDGTFVEVEGVFDNGTIAAAKVKLEDEGGPPGQPEAKGYVSASNATAGTVTIDLIEWFGFNGSFGAAQVVQTTGTTEFEDADGSSMTKEQFFAALSNGMVVDAKGSYSGGVLTATRARIRD